MFAIETGAAAVRAPGWRRPTAALRAAERVAAQGAGLPPGMGRWQLLALLRGAARPLGLTAPMLALLTLYVEESWDQDWAAGAEPVVPVPMAEIAAALGRSERQVRNIEAALARRGLLCWRDSGNHQRRGRRDPRSGALLWAFGPSLAPLRARAGEIAALAAAMRAERAEARRLRLGLSGHRARIRAELAELDPAAPGVPALAALAAALPRRAPAALAALRAAHAEAAALRAALAALAGTGAAAAGLAEISRPPSSDDHPETAMNGSAGPAAAGPAAAPPPGRTREAVRTGEVPEDRLARRGPGRGPGGESGPRLGRGPGGGGAGPRPALTPALARAAAGPALAALWPPGPPRWSGLVAAAGALAPGFGIGAPLWAESCARLGREGAALCLLLLEQALRRPDEGRLPPVTRPGGYFRALAARAAAGRLDLAAALARLVPEAPPRAPAGRGPGAGSAGAADPARRPGREALVGEIGRPGGERPLAPCRGRRLTAAEAEAREQGGQEEEAGRAPEPEDQHGAEAGAAGGPARPAEQRGAAIGAEDQPERKAHDVTRRRRAVPGRSLTGQA